MILRVYDITPFFVTNFNLIFKYLKILKIEFYMAVEVNKVIYSMVGVSKFYNNKPVL
jgi:hypothetical protein